jgi:hypothetical protein
MTQVIQNELTCIYRALAKQVIKRKTVKIGGGVWHNEQKTLPMVVYRRRFPMPRCEVASSQSQRACQVFVRRLLPELGQ